MVAQPHLKTQIRDDFPVLKDPAFSYLDTAASAQKPQQVIEAMNAVLRNHYANIHRGEYHLSQKTTSLYESVRGKIQRFISAPREDEVVFTRNTTEAINLVASSWGRAYFKPGDEILISEMEHHANIVPWQMLRDQLGIKLMVLPVTDEGEWDLEALPQLLTERTRFAALVHVSNALGTINPVQEVTRAIKAHNPDIKVLIDGSQSVVHAQVDVQELGCDFFVFTGHKLYGPTGVGVLWAHYEILESMPPFLGGGDMIEEVSFEKTTYRAPPQKFEAGTPPVVEVIGLGASIDYLENLGLQYVHDQEQELLAYGTEGLLGIDGVTMVGTAPHKAGIMSFIVEGVHHSDLAAILDQQGVAVRAGHHCCMPLMQRYGLKGTARASLGAYSSRADLDKLFKALHKAIRILG